MHRNDILFTLRKTNFGLVCNIWISVEFFWNTKLANHRQLHLGEGMVLGKSFPKEAKGGN